MSSELNKYTRASGLSRSVALPHLCADLTAAFDNFDGVTCEPLYAVSIDGGDSVYFTSSCDGSTYTATVTVVDGDTGFTVTSDGGVTTLSSDESFSMSEVTAGTLSDYSADTAGYYTVTMTVTTDSDENASYSFAFEETSTTSTAAATKIIYLDSDFRQYLSLTDGSKAPEIYAYNGTNSTTVYAVGSTSSVLYTNYLIVRTSYGIAFGVLADTGTTSALATTYLRSFFTTFTNSDGDTINGFVCVSGASDNTTSNTVSTTTEALSAFETSSASTIFRAPDAAQTQLSAWALYSQPWHAEHLYSKTMCETGTYGKITLDDRNFIAGSIMCLEYLDD